MIRAIIIDDEPLARSIVIEFLEGFPEIEVLQECNDGFEGAKAIMKHRPELIFLDIQMPKINGFEMLEILDYAPAVIFTTAFDEYAIKAFESHAIDYLLKPFAKERFEKAVGKFLNPVTLQQQVSKTESLMQSSETHSAGQDRIVVKNAGKIRIIPFSQVLYLEAADDYVKVHTAEGGILKNKTMGFFEQVLPSKQFVRTHRSYIINVLEITRIDPYEKENHLAILRNGARIPVSKSGYARLKSVLGL